MTPREGKGQRPKEGELVGCTRGGRCPQTQVEGEPRGRFASGRLPPSPRPGRSASSLHPSGAPGAPRARCCAQEAPLVHGVALGSCEDRRPQLQPGLHRGWRGCACPRRACRGATRQSAHRTQPYLGEHSCHDKSHRSLWGFVELGSPTF